MNQLSLRCLCRSWNYNRSVHEVLLPEINNQFGLWKDIQYFCLTDKTEERSSGRHIIVGGCGMWVVKLMFCLTLYLWGMCDVLGIESRYEYSVNL